MEIADGTNFDQLKVNLLQNEDTGDLVLEFGETVSWIELTPEEAIILGTELVKFAEAAMTTKPVSSLSN